MSIAFRCVAAPVSHTGHLNRHRADPYYHLAFRQVAVANQPNAIIINFVRLVEIVMLAAK